MATKVVAKVQMAKMVPQGDGTGQVGVCVYGFAGALNKANWLADAKARDLRVVDHPELGFAEFHRDAKKTG